MLTVNVSDSCQGMKPIVCRCLQIQMHHHQNELGIRRNTPWLSYLTMFVLAFAAETGGLILC